MLKSTIGVLKEAFCVTILHKVQNSKDMISKGKDFERITYSALMFFL